MSTCSPIYSKCNARMKIRMIVIQKIVQQFMAEQKNAHIHSHTFLYQFSLITIFFLLFNVRDSQSGVKPCHMYKSFDAIFCCCCCRYFFFFSKISIVCRKVDSSQVNWKSFHLSHRSQFILHLFHLFLSVVGIWISIVVLFFCVTCWFCELCTHLSMFSFIIYWRLINWQWMQSNFAKIYSTNREKKKTHTHT